MTGIGRVGTVTWQRYWLTRARETLLDRGQPHLADLIDPNIPAEPIFHHWAYVHRVAVATVGGIRGDSEDPAWAATAKGWDRYCRWVRNGAGR